MRRELIMQMSQGPAPLPRRLLGADDLEVRVDEDVMRPVDAEDVADPALAGCTITCVAAMVVPLVVPSARTGSPVVTAPAEVELVPR